MSFATRTGLTPGGGLVYMPINDVIEENDSELYGAEVGDLGDELARAGIARSVIANGDGSDPSTPEERVPPYRRSAVAALMTHDGKVPGGRVDRDLLQADRGAPFGVRLDPDQVLDSFRESWTDRAVVLVEGSDLVRAELAGRFASDEQRERLRTRALRDTDDLVGRLLDDVDPQRDAVIVVGPAPPTERPSLTPVSVRAPGFGRGLLRSTTTRKDGFVSMVDVAPTILHLYGLERPKSMEGRKMESADSSENLAGRVSFLVDANEDGLFRDSQVGPSMTTVLVIACVLAVGGALVDRLRTRTPKWARRGAWPLTILALALDRVPRRDVPRRSLPLRTSRWCRAVLVVHRGRDRAAHRAVPRGDARATWCARCSSRSGASSCCTSSISSPARISNGTRSSATRRPSASASWARGT